MIVLDFWATWCNPCRAQHPLYEAGESHVPKKLTDVVFLAVDADEDHSMVKPFLESQMNGTRRSTSKTVLQSCCRFPSIPTTIIFGKKGEIFSRMIGYLPDRFVDMLTDRVNEALGSARGGQSARGAA